MSNLIHKNEKGIVLTTGLIFVAIIALLGATALIVTTTDIKIGSNYKSSLQAFYAADAGIEYGLSKMRQAFQSLYPDLTTVSPPTINNVTFDEFKIESDGNPSTIVLDGTFAGLTAWVQNYQITSKARMNSSKACSKLALKVRDELIPIFQFGIFYEEDMEILPGKDMTFTGGRIHSNSNIYLDTDSSATLSIDATITSAGNIYHCRKDRTDTPGTVQIKDKNGNYQTMNIDSDSENWTTQSQTLWDGTVKSKEHGIHELNLPTQTETPIDILGTGPGSLYLKAGLSIIDGVAYDKDGNTVDLTDGGTVDDPIPPSPTFYDYREDKVITVTEIDLSKLQSSTNAMDALNDPPDGGDKGILYVSSTDGSESVRLTEGSNLPSTGLTVVSNNPVYIQGDYNNSTNSPAAVIGDAITILSNNWNDANSSSTNLNDRTASDTTVNAAIMAGNKNTVDSQYSGGVENFPRFLENWSGKTLTYVGSLICLWESQQATGNWQYGSPIYQAPYRNWSYGIDANNLPPGTPRVRNISKSGWHPVIE